MKKHIVKALKWALNKFERPSEEIAAWPFPAPKEEPVKKRPQIKKATTRTVAKKATTVAKKTTKKAK
jgi:hypothetical protein